MTSNRTSAVQFPLCLNVGFMSLFRGREVPQSYLDTINLNGRPPLSVVVVRANQSRATSSMGFSLVVSIARVVNLPKIAYPVIQRIPVDVIQYWAGLFPVEMQPRNTVSVMGCTINFNYFASAFANSPDRSVQFNGMGALYFARKLAGLWIVVKEFAHTLCGKWWSLLFDGGVAQVRYPVVSWVFVSVKDSFFRKLTVNVKPRKGVRGVLSFVNANDGSSGTSGSPCNSSSKNWAVNFAPRENSGFWAVVQNFLEPVLSQGKLTSSHAVSPVKKWCGQKPGSVDALVGLRHFNMGCV